jgi:RimJ/RimL family protein N-acetyltransferase
MEGLAAEQVRPLLHWLKDGPLGAIPIERDGRSLGLLQAVTWEDAGDRVALERLSRWHEFAWFPEPFPVSPASIRRWLVEQVLPVGDRILFWVKDVRGGFVGHVGLSRFDYAARAVSVSDHVSSGPSSAGLMAAAVESLARWAAESLQLHVRASGQAAAA